jgi:hypothetical protein
VYVTSAFLSGRGGAPFFIPNTDNLRYPEPKTPLVPFMSAGDLFQEVHDLARSLRVVLASVLGKVSYEGSQ